MCLKCGGGGLIYHEREVYEDYSPHGGFWVTDSREEFCTCPAGDREDMRGQAPPEPRELLDDYGF